MENKKERPMKKYFAEDPNFPTISTEMLAPLIVKWGLRIIGIGLIIWLAVWLILKFFV